MADRNKPLVWLKGEVKTPPFSAAARLEAGLLLRQLQRGDTLSLPHSRPMPSIGRSVHELRIPDADATWRIVYRIDADAIVIGEVFAKKTAQTPHLVIGPRQSRFKQLRSDDMKTAKRQKLETAGWKVGSTADFLGLSPEETALVDMRVALSQTLRAWRTKKRLTQGDLAKALRSSQSRVAKMEAADPTVSLDLLMRSLLHLGARTKDIAKAIA